MARLDEHLLTVFDKTAELIRSNVKPTAIMPADDVDVIDLAFRNACATFTCLVMNEALVDPLTRVTEHEFDAWMKTKWSVVENKAYTYIWRKTREVREEVPALDSRKLKAWEHQRDTALDLAFLLGWEIAHDLLPDCHSHRK